MRREGNKEVELKGDIEINKGWWKWRNVRNIRLK
jgi:hypothetical protein